MSDFDPYHKWLGISETARPVSKYRLLSIDEFESDRDVISTAAERQTVFLRTLQAGEHSILVAELLNEVSQARVTLLNADQKAVYDEELREQQTPEPEPEPTPPPIPVVQTPSPTPVVVRGTVTQEFPVSVVQSAKKPRRRKPKQIWKRPVVIGVSVVGVIGVLALFISLMSSGDADPVASKSPPVVSVPLILSPEPVPAQATANTLPPSLREGLVAYYPFNGNARDESGNARDVEKLYHSWTDGVGGQAKGAVRFRRGSKRIAVPRSLQEARYEFTVSLWARIALDPEPGRIFPTVFGKGGAGMGSGYAIYLWPNASLEDSPNASLKKGWLADIHLADGSKSLHFASDEMVPLSQGVWYHLVLTCSKDIARLYANNQDVQSHENVPDTARADEAPILIGGNAHGGGTQCWDGAIDNVRIYNRALSEAEVKALYDYESKPPASSTPTAPAIESITNTIGMTLNKIPAGTFMMGSPEDEEGRRDNEHQHKVTISKAFYMQTTEVTQRQWKEVMGTEPWKGEQYVIEHPNYPATYVSWDHAVAYCEKLSEEEGNTYRLPNEAEWEYACRAGTKTTWSFGNDEKVLGDYAWYRENAWDIDQKHAHHVAVKKPNAFGLYNMHGNVWEWCHDYYGDHRLSPEHDPQGPASGSSRVLRGGSWDIDIRGTRSALRNRLDAVNRGNNIGFRVVRELD